LPFFYQQNINETRHLAIWSITEPVSFFETDVKLTVDIQNEERKIQHLAVRLLFKLMMPDADLNNMVMADNGKPYLQGVPFHFSFSHCKGYAAVAVSDKDSIGIDIETIHPRILKVAHKFLNESEKNLIAALPEAAQLNQMAFFWAAKEAMYKQYENLGIDFAKDFNVLQIANEQKGVVSAQILHKGINCPVQLDYHFGEDYVCVTCFSTSN
jgi:phosphopantetheine--protein transferase-like protein